MSKIGDFFDYVGTHINKFFSDMSFTVSTGEDPLLDDDIHGDSNINTNIERGGYNENMANGNIQGGYSYDPLAGAAQLLNAGAQIYGAYKNYELGQDQLKYQKEIDAKNLDLSERQFAESQYQYEKNYNQQEFWANVSQNNFENATQIRANDLAKAGLNPLLASSANGMEVSPSSSSGVSGSQVNSNAQAPQLDLSALGMALEGYANRRLERERINKEYQLRSREIANQEKQTQNEYELGKERNKNDRTRNEIMDKQVQEFIDNNIRENEVKKLIANETSRHNAELELLEKMGLDAKRAERVLQQAKQDDDYQLTLKQIELEKQKMEQSKDIADKNRRMEYITKLTHTLFNGVIKIGQSLLGVAGGGSSSNPIGFFAD